MVSFRTAQLYQMDLQLARVVHSHFGKTRHACMFWELISHMGDGIFWFGMVLPCLGLNWLTSYWTFSPSTVQLIYFFYLCNVVDIFMIIGLKLIFKRPRPPHHQTDGRFVGPDNHSFPSGHATRCWCIMGMFTCIQRGMKPSIVFETKVPH